MAEADSILLLVHAVLRLDLRQEAAYTAQQPLRGATLSPAPSGGSSHATLDCRRGEPDQGRHCIYDVGRVQPHCMGRLQAMLARQTLLP